MHAASIINKVAFLQHCDTFLNDVIGLLPMQPAQQKPAACLDMCLSDIIAYAWTC